MNAQLKREAFRTSRLLDFFSEKELTAQVGHDKDLWPLVAVKELVDNALDACEEARVAPVIQIRVGETSIEISDNGPGLPEDAICGILDFSVRLSSREAYVSPTRGAQGNALKTIVAMPFVLDGECGLVEISSRGVIRAITCRVDRIKQEPVISVDRKPFVKNGTSVKIHLPNSARLILDAAESEILLMARNYVWLNPHASIGLNLLDKEYSWTALDPKWTKWRACDPTSPHWYTLEDLKRLIAAHINHTQEKTVREFVAEFRGLSSSAKQKAVLGETGLSRQTLSSFFVDGNWDDGAIKALLLSMQNESTPVKASALGVAGKDNLKALFESSGCEMKSFRHCFHKSDSAIPYSYEMAFAWKEDLERRTLITGVNFSPAIGNPFRTLPYMSWGGLDGLLREMRCGPDEPVVLFIHAVCPRVRYSDRGKTAVIMEE